MEDQSEEIKAKQINTIAQAGFRLASAAFQMKNICAFNLTKLHGNDIILLSALQNTITMPLLKWSVHNVSFYIMLAAKESTK